MYKDMFVEGEGFVLHVSHNDFNGGKMTALYVGFGSAKHTFFTLFSVPEKGMVISNIPDLLHLLLDKQGMGFSEGDWGCALFDYAE